MNIKSNNRKVLLFITILIISIQHLFADSPLTSTQFYQAYMDIEIVQKAKMSGKLDIDIYNYLQNDSVSIDKKAAVINALSWDINGKNNAQHFINYRKQYFESNNIPVKYWEIDSTYSNLTANEMFCIGYLTALDDYFNPIKAYKILKVGYLKNIEDFTYNFIYALVEAQLFSDKYQFCYMTQVCREVNENQRFKKNMRNEAIDIVLKYTEIAAESCVGEDGKKAYDYFRDVDTLSFNVYKLLKSNPFIASKSRDNINSYIINLDKQGLDLVYEQLLKAKKDRSSKTEKRQKLALTILRARFGSSNRQIFNNPNNQNALVMRAEVFLDIGNNEQACIDLLRAKELGSMEADTLYNEHCK